MYLLLTKPWRWWRCLCALVIRRGMLCGAYAPGRATHARQVKGEKSDKYSERGSHRQQGDGWRYWQVMWFHNWLLLHVFIWRQTTQVSWALHLECPEPSVQVVQCVSTLLNYNGDKSKSTAPGPRHSKEKGC